MKIICIGRNYSEHAKELNNEIPDEPVIFIKPKNALIMSGKPLYYPEFTDNLQYECEVVVRLSKNGKYIQERYAHKYYNEVSVGIDFTARDLQEKQKKKGLPWEIAKAFDSSAAIGTFIPITEEMNLNSLNFELKLNGETVQKDNTKNMLFNINKIIEYASRFFTLNIGDVIFTGTPAGVGSLSVYDKLEGYLEGQKLLDIEIR
jgi:2-keto-4-pentenoate hydratase/2-oxohepta-3-ene-1,7-dioic acid hydratase in catechol pathway